MRDEGERASPFSKGGDVWVCWLVNGNKQRKNGISVGMTGIILGRSVERPYKENDGLMRANGQARFLRGDE